MANTRSLSICIGILFTAVSVAAFSTSSHSTKNKRTSASVPAKGFLPCSPLSSSQMESSSSLHDNSIAERRSRNHRRNPTFLEKQWRRFVVFRTALQVFLDYKWAGFQANRTKKRLGLAVNDPDSDDHEDVRSLWLGVHTRNADFLLHKIQNLEGFWVKVGQYMSTRADVLPPVYLETLGSLQDSMPPRSWDATMATITEELGDDAVQLTIDREPLSTASLAQVHRATLLLNSTTTTTNETTTQDVVIKVQHRGVAQLMMQDMENLRFILNLLAKTDKDLDFGPVIKEYNKEVRKELHFRTEAKNMAEVKGFLTKAAVTAIVPDAVPHLVTERVLVMDFCEGFPVRDTDKLDTYNVDREVLLERVCAAWAVQMHVGGLFNADPHMGNILVSTAVPGDASVPVLLDFGLTKRLDPKMKVAFARLMHSSYENDVDALLQSFEEMGLKMNRHNPFEDMANMQRGFSDTTPQSQVREESKQKGRDYERRLEAKRAEEGLKKGEKLRNPVEAWPSELVFFGRVSAMLRGMCSRLDVRYPYLRTMAMAARETLQNTVPVEQRAEGTIHPSATAISSTLQKRLVKTIKELSDIGQVAGLQVCVRKHGDEIANIAAGTIGLANPRPVTPDTLFNIFSVSKGVLTIGLLRLLQDGRIKSLDDPVATYWQAFGNKPTVTVRHLLSHQAGLANAYPEVATLDTLLDWEAMKIFMAEKAIPSHEPGTKTEYHALSFAWLVGGLIEEVTGEPYDAWLDEILPDIDGQQAVGLKNLYLAGIPDELDDKSDFAVLSLDRSQTREKEVTPSTSNGDEMNEVSMKKANDDDATSRQKARKVLDKYRGIQQLMNPSVFNMRKVRQAKLPSANGHSSASALALVFDSVLRDEKVLSTDVLELARTPSTNKTVKEGQDAAMLDDGNSQFGLGFQLHGFSLANGETVQSIGHAGLGGSLVVAIPEEEVVIALTLSKLSSDSLARRHILGVIFDHLDLNAPASLPHTAASDVDDLVVYQ